MVGQGLEVILITFRFIQFRGRVRWGLRFAFDRHVDGHPLDAVAVTVVEVALVRGRLLRSVGLNSGDPDNLG